MSQSFKKGVGDFAKKYLLPEENVDDLIAKVRQKTFEISLPLNFLAFIDCLLERSSIDSSYFLRFSDGYRHDGQEGFDHFSC